MSTETYGNAPARPRNNLRTDSLNTWAWDSQAPAKSLSGLRDACIQFGEETADYYNHKKKWKQRLAKGFRSISILIASASALLLLCSQQPEGLPSSWATAAMIVAGAFVALDHFFGYTTAWIRFIEAANEIRVLVRQFKLDWEQQAATWTNEKPTSEQVSLAMSLAQGFVAAVDQVVTTEIDRWATQFRANLAQHNRRVAAALEDKAPVASSQPPVEQQAANKRTSRRGRRTPEA